LHFSYFMCSQIISKKHMNHCVDSFSFSLHKYIVHDLNPTCNSNNPNLTIVFFHGIALGTNDEWKETWTTRPTNNRIKCICCPEKWLPKDLNNNLEFYHCPMILTLWEVFTMKWLKLVKTSFKVCLQIQGATISSIYGHINYYSLCTLKLIFYTFRISYMFCMN
jgi:hypothetical protein